MTVFFNSGLYSVRELFKNSQAVANMIAISMTLYFKGLLSSIDSNHGWKKLTIFYTYFKDILKSQAIIIMTAISMTLSHS